MPSSKSSMCAGVSLMLLFLAGCSSSPPSPLTSAMDEANLGGPQYAQNTPQAAGRQTRIVSLGAGDFLGRQIHETNIMLAQRRNSDSWEAQSLRGGPSLGRPATVVDVPVLTD